MEWELHYFPFSCTCRLSWVLPSENSFILKYSGHNGGKKALLAALGDSGIHPVYEWQCECISGVIWGRWKQVLRCKFTPFPTHVTVRSLWYFAGFQFVSSSLIKNCVFQEWSLTFSLTETQKYDFTCNGIAYSNSTSCFHDDRPHFPSPHTFSFPPLHQVLKSLY